MSEPITPAKDREGRCAGRYPVPPPRDDDATYRCGRLIGHTGRHGADEDADKPMVSQSMTEPTITPATDELHPTGRCSCGGEGRCEWCVTLEERIAKMTPEERAFMDRGEDALFEIIATLRTQIEELVERMGQLQPQSYRAWMGSLGGEGTRPCDCNTFPHKPDCGQWVEKVIQQQKQIAELEARIINLKHALHAEMGKFSDECLVCAVETKDRERFDA